MGNNERFSPQLVMRLEGFDSLPSLELPEGYTVRAARPGEESFGWTSLTIPSAIPNRPLTI